MAHQEFSEVGNVGTATFAIVERFLAEARAAPSARMLEDLLAQATGALGFDFYALVEHGTSSRPARLFMTNYPQRWRKTYDRQRLGRRDPVQQACVRRVSGFRWSDLANTIAMTPAQQEILRASRHHGIGDGFSVPLHLPGANDASCSFAVRVDAVLPLASLMPAQLIALASYERLIALADGVRASPICLSPRQRACVALIAAGLTDRQVGRYLALSEETVTKYLNEARRRNGMTRRAQLVIAALRDGLIGYDVLETDSLGHIAPH